MKMNTFVSTVAIFALGSTVALAALTGPSYPPPGGATFANSGTSAGQTSGSTLFYHGLDPLQYNELYHTFYQIDNPWHGSQGSSTGQMTFDSYDPATGITTWNSTTDMIWSSNSGLEDVATRLLVQFQPYTGAQNGQLVSGWLTPTTAAAAGITTLAPNWSVLDVAALTDPTDDFQVWFRYQTASGTPLHSYYDNSHSLGGSVNTAISSAFYSAVPEPSTWLLLGLGGIGFALFGRNRNSRKLAS